nr:hypothetical protein CFP56_09269 [Quercus suber]
MSDIRDHERPGPTWSRPGSLLTCRRRIQKGSILISSPFVSLTATASVRPWYYSDPSPLSSSDSTTHRFHIIRDYLGARTRLQISTRMLHAVYET